MNSSWTKKQLGDVCDIIGGGTPSKDNAAFYSGSIPWATVRDMGKAVLDKTEFYITKEAVSNSATNVIPKGNIIIASRVGLGKVCILKNDTAINQDLRAIIPKSNNLSRHYLFWWFSSVANYIVSQGNGATVKGVTLPFLKSLLIPLPPLLEQERIVGILDAAFEKIDTIQRNAERNLASAKELFQQVLNEEMAPKPGWKKVLLSEVCKDFGRGRSKHRPRNDKSLYGGCYPFIQTGDIRKANHVISKFTQTYNKKGLEQSKLWPCGTLCITIAANIAETAILGFDACFPDSVIGCVVDTEKISVDFLEFLLQYYKQSLKAVGESRRSAQDNINIGTFETYRFAIPLDRKEQDRIVVKLKGLLDPCDQFESHCSGIVFLCNELKQQVLTKAFNGEL